MKKIGVVLPLLLASGLVLAEGAGTVRVEYKVEWSDGHTASIVAHPGSPAMMSLASQSKDSPCRFESAQGGSVTLSLGQSDATSAMFVMDTIDDAGVKTLLAITSSVSHDDGKKPFLSGDCSIQTGAASTSSIIRIDSLAWDQKRRYAFPDGSVVTVTPHRL